VILIVSDSRDTYHLVVDRLTADAGAELIELDPARHDGTLSKRSILRQLATPRLRRLRGRWSGADTVLVMSWYLIPVLALIRLGLLPRPRRLVSLGVFVHDERLRRGVNTVLRALADDALEFIAFSEAERRNLVDVVRVPVDRVHRVLYRGKIPEAAETLAASGDYIFAGGYSNRDYETFFTAVAPLGHRVIAVASARNEISDPPANVDLRLDIPWDDFTALLDGCALLVLPLRPGGEACGQSVLVRAIRSLRPVVATHHDAVVEYLGHDYPGFVRASDATALRAAIVRALEDTDERRALLERIRIAARSLRALEDVEAEIAGIVTGRPELVRA
jgi:glycosyltransferase involved in cell wall biosynthesis